jgi:hypothetical protein
MIEKLKREIPVKEIYNEYRKKFDEIIDETNTHERCQAAAFQTVCGKLNDLQSQIINIEKNLGQFYRIKEPQFKPVELQPGDHFGHNGKVYRVLSSDGGKIEVVRI